MNTLDTIFDYAQRVERLIYSGRALEKDWTGRTAIVRATTILMQLSEQAEQEMIVNFDARTNVRQSVLSRPSVPMVWRESKPRTASPLAAERPTRS